MTNTFDNKTLQVLKSQKTSNYYFDLMIALCNFYVKLVASLLLIYCAVPKIWPSRLFIKLIALTWLSRGDIKYQELVI